MAWGTAKNGPNAWVPASHMGHPDGAPGSWLRLGPVLTISAIWAVNQHMDDPAHSIILTYKIYKSFFKRKGSKTCDNINEPLKPIQDGRKPQKTMYYMNPFV